MAKSSKKTRQGPKQPKTACETITIGLTTFRLRYTQALPGLVEQEFDDLLNDIARRGIIHRIVIDEDGNVIDGAHRLRVASMLGLTQIPTLVVTGLSDAEKQQLAEDINLHRRHLSPLEIAKVARRNKERLPQLAVRLRQKGMSYRQIGDALGVSHSHVRGLITQATGKTNTVDLPNVITGKDGKKRRAKAKPKPLSAVYVSTVREIPLAAQACKTAGPGGLPNRTITLKSAKNAARKEVIRNLREQDYEDLDLGHTKLMLGDFRKRCSEIDDSSVDLCFTDPLYEKDALPIWRDLAEVCSRKLRPGGLLVAYSGVMYLPTIHQMLGEHLSYHWVGAIRHTGNIKLVRSVQMLQAWKPILIYYRPPLSKYWRPFKDMTSGGESKSNHIYEQSVGEALHFIKGFCPPNGVLWDPMMGSGTSIVAGLRADLGLECIGCEIDKAAYAAAEKRIQATIDELQARRDSA